MERRPWHVTDPEQMLRAVHEICPLRVGQVIVAALAIGTQQVTDAQVAASGGRLEEHHDRSDRVRALAEQMVPERWATSSEGHGMTHVLITIVCREGRVVFTHHEHTWLKAWRYANHFRGAFDGDVYVVTPHGWAGVLDQRAGFEPCAAVDAA